MTKAFSPPSFDEGENMTKIGAFIVSYTDSGFTNPHELLSSKPPTDQSERFTHMGACYSGLETCRHGDTRCDEENKRFIFSKDGHHECHIGFTDRARISKISLSTKWFTGNQARWIEIELIDSETKKRSIAVKRQTVTPDSEVTFEIPSIEATDCILRLFPDGGVARIEFEGEVAVHSERKNLLDEATISHVSNEHYGSPAKAVAGNRAENHMVGWESSRSGYGEHALFTLGEPSVVKEFIVDTYLYRLNSPLGCYLFGLPEECNLEEAMQARPRWKVTFDDGSHDFPEDFQSYMINREFEKESSKDELYIECEAEEDSPWITLIDFGALKPDTFHRFDIGYEDSLKHLLFVFYPNGGIHGLKAFS